MMKKFAKVLCVGLSVSTGVVSALDDQIPSVETLRKVLHAKYEYPLYKWQSFAKMINRMDDYRKTASSAEVDASEEFILTETLSFPVANVHDCEYVSDDLFAMDFYLREISQWKHVRDMTNSLMRIADKIGQYQLLPDIESTDALRLAHKIDQYVEYGTNQPPKRYGGVTGVLRWKPWFGPIGSRIAKIIDFRRLYNSRVTYMRKRALLNFHHAIMECFCGDNHPYSAEENAALWKEFVRRAKATEEEIARAENR